MIKRFLYVIIEFIIVVLNFITFFPIFLLVMLWVIVIETLAWVVTGHTIMKDPLDAMDFVLWGGPVSYYIENKLKLNLYED